jgi:hypothetical protein
MSIHDRILKKAASVNGETLRPWTDWKKPDQGGALRKYPVDIFSERASLQGSVKTLSA